jgi:hypothetical protein
MTVELLTFDMFKDRVGETFVVEEKEMPAVELTLAEATPLRNYAKLARAPFSLIFTTKGVGQMMQRMYALRHPALGLHLIFLVPVGRDGDVASYQAVFN